MNRLSISLILALLLFLFTQPAPAAPKHAALLPVVGGAALPPVNPEPVKLLDCSCGDATVGLRADGRIYVMIQDFDRGGKLFVYEDNLTTFKPAAELPGVSAAAPPSFQVPGQKHGPGGFVFLADRMVIYAPARPEGVFEGDYALYRYEIALTDLP